MLQKRADKGIFDFIGGCMELGGSSGDTFVREFRGESGIEIESLCLLNVYTNFEDSYPNGDVAQTIGLANEVKALRDYDMSYFHNEETLELGYFSGRSSERTCCKCSASVHFR